MMAPRRRLFCWLLAALLGVASATTGCGDETPSPSDTDPVSRTDAADTGFDTRQSRDSARDPI
ncbi:MAG: hypothetical protein ABEN55_14480, partial [Bradymonadaceae bacterium]